MGIQLNHISGATLSLLAVAAIAAPVGLAQEAPPQTIPQAFDGLTTNYSGNFFRNRTISRQAARIVGLGFPENEITWDANATATAMRDLMRLQNTIDPAIRVPDMSSPFNTSLLTMPSSQFPTVGTEFIFERY
jgi:hypothetical protein